MDTHLSAVSRWDATTDPAVKKAVCTRSSSCEFMSTLSGAGLRVWVDFAAHLFRGPRAFINRCGALKRGLSFLGKEVTN